MSEPRPEGAGLADGSSSGRREAILDAATDLFAEHGFNDADTQVLADRLGVGKGTLYRCFASKRELFLAAVDRVMLRLRERIDAKTAGVVDPLEQLAIVIRAYLDFFRENPAYVELLIQERALFKDRTTPTFIEHRERQLARWRAMYRSLMEEGRLREMPVDRITDVVGHLIYGTMFTNYFTGRDASSEDQARDILDVIYLGILSEPERRARIEAESGG